jgi:hypothetical protein
MPTGATNYIGADQDGPYSAQDLGWYYDGTTWTKMSVMAATSPLVFMVRATALVFTDKKTVELIPGALPTGLVSNSAGSLTQLDLSGNKQFKQDSYDHSVMGVRETLTDSSMLMGYNVWRTDPGSGALPPYHKRNTTLISGTSYQDVIGLDSVNYGYYKYFVTAVFNDTQANAWLCESLGSDTVTIKFPAVGIENITNGSIMVYPNPANDYVNVKSDYNISRVDVLNFIGQAIYTQSANDSKQMRINTTTAGRRLLHQG